MDYIPAFLQSAIFIYEKCRLKEAFKSIFLTNA